MQQLHVCMSVYVLYCCILLYFTRLISNNVKYEKQNLPNVLSHLDISIQSHTWV